MAKVKINSMTEKGMLKAQVREVIANKELEAFKDNNLVDYEKTEKGASMFKEYVDSEGRVIYATFTLTVSYKNPNEKTPKTKAKKSDGEDTFALVE